ncbi:hypothetical protein JCM5805K_1914 [Lactococcus lactis subsp. lactis]|uniref:Uncharacterized protein n=1 Tax=Lactococcus lactis subsp. lactis TaxID=1360 RepID=A0A0B8R0T1_LACLL|nr:hypothetical protein JCM5805K_1914 [Lactococcus lactis subsp. lactis]
MKLIPKLLLKKWEKYVLESPSCEAIISKEILWS